MISVIIPVLNESTNIANVVRFAKTQTRVSEVIVVDDGSIDGTPQIASRAGAKVITSSLLGKGASMADGLAVAKNEWVVFLDGDLKGLAPDLVDRLTHPLRTQRSNFVKARFKREAGRVTLLTAKPLINIFFPELSSIDQPLGGILAASKSTLRKIELEIDYGVDLGMLIDVQMLGEQVEEVDIGSIRHESKPLANLSEMASQVTRTLLHRAAKYNRLGIERVMEFEESELQMNVKHSNSLANLGSPQRIALFDMDGTLVQGRYISQLAKCTDLERELAQFLDHSSMDPIDRTRSIARIFKNVPKEIFVTIARQMPLMHDAVDTVRGLRQLGYQVGIVTDSFQVAAETIRRRVFADFSLAHFMRFRGGRALGELELCQSMYHEYGCPDHVLCKKNAVLRLAEETGVPLKDILAVGDGENDICMLRTVGTGIAFHPKSQAVRRAVPRVIDDSLSSVLHWVPERFRSNTAIDALVLNSTNRVIEPKCSLPKRRTLKSDSIFPKVKWLTGELTSDSIVKID